jgi:hypothetical protein
MVYFKQRHHEQDNLFALRSGPDGRAKKREKKKRERERERERDLQSTLARTASFLPN